MTIFPTRSPFSAILLMPLVAALTACGPAGPEIGGFPLEDFPGVGEPPRIVLVDSGEGEKSGLRYRLDAGSIHHMVMVMTMSNPQVPAIQMPGVRFAVVMKVLEANEDRARLSMSMPKDPDLIATEGAPPELVANLSEGFRGMSAFRGQSTLTSLGVTEELELQFDTEDPRLEQFLGSMKQSMRQLTIPFPAEPVGVGARWKTLQQIVGLVTVYQLGSFELLQRAGSSVTLGMKLEQLTPKQAIALPGTPPEVTVDVSAEVAGSGQGDGEMTLNLYSPVPRSHASLESVTTMTVRAGDEVREMVMNMTVLVEVEPRGLEHAVEADESSP